MRGVVHGVIIMIPVLCTVIAYILRPPVNGGEFLGYVLFGALGVSCALIAIWPKQPRNHDGVDMRSVLSVLPPVAETNDWEDEH